MSFLAPLFLLGGLAIALPVIFHLIRRTTKDRTVFSSLMFLLPTPPRLTRRSRLEHILLLVLRCLVLCLLAFGFARPFIKKAISDDAPAGAARRIVVLVDSSASMRRANLWTGARDKVDSLLRKTSPADQVAVFTFDRQLNPLVTFEQWNAAPSGGRAALATGRLKETSPGWSATHLGIALISAAESLADSDGKQFTGPRQIVLLSDLQEGSQLNQLQGYEWPKGIEVSIEPLKAKPASNAGLQLVTDSDDADPKASASVRVRVSNAADSKREQFKIGWAQADGRSFVGQPANVYVPPGQSRIVPLPALPLPSLEGLGVGPVDRIVLQGDDEDFDNTVFVVPPETARLSVVYFGGESEKDPRQPLYFLQRAFQETRRQAVQVLVRPPATPLTEGEAKTAALFVITDALPEPQARALHDQAAAGKTILFALKSQAASATLARLLSLDNLAIEEARPDNYAMLAEIDFRHPLFAPFADPRFSDFTKIHFWKYRRLDPATIPNARVVAKFDSGDPAVFEVPVGKGRVIVLTSGWHSDDSQLALSTKFVPLLYSALDYSGAAPAPPEQFHVGDVVPLDSSPPGRRQGWVVRAPDGSELNLSSGETNFSRTMTPGVYSVAPQPLSEPSAAPSQRPKRFAVNLDPAESRTAPLPVDEFERLGTPLAHASATVAREAARKVQLQTAELEGRQKLWRWFIVATLAVLLMETWLAGRTARRLVTPGEATT
ncbi:MAG TPA: BatA domain-containing protein [Verrucomicrobiae bacterium]|nr:BatA domain-containing protein [Verrucomicrobiae bacterium]